GKRNLRILCGGEAMTRGLADRLLEKGQEVWNLYGPTETTVWSTVERVAPGTDAITVGRPIDNTQVYVVDPALRLAPHGVIGELVIGGDGLATGYLNREELTTSRFVPDPFRPGPGRRLYRTGDRARFLPDGRLECLGRMDHQVKVRGYRIELGEIEAVINADAGVKQGIAIAREEPGGETRLVAYVVPAAVSDDEHAVESWARLWDATYAGGITPGTDPTFDTSGWRSSYTSEALSADDLKEWVDHTAARIRRLAPTRVLEIGCGTGLIVYRVAPGTERYTAVDAAAGPIARLEQEGVRRGLGQVVAHVAHADKAASLVDGPVNLLVINSVAQYFPSVEYLVLVMERAMAVMPAGSHIFLGDIRNRDLLGAFGASIALAQAADESSTEEVARAAAERQARESELLFAPAFFEGLRSRLPRITRVQLATKGGRRRNEMNAFRYDVVLEIDGPGDLVEIPTRVDARGFSLGDIASRLASGQRAIAFEGIPDARNAPDLWLAGALERPTAATTTAADLRRAMADVDQGLHPEDVVALAGALDVEISPSIDHPGAFDATFRTPDALASPRTV